MREICSKHWLGWIGMVLVLLGYFLNANLNPNSWLLWIFGNALVGAYSFAREAYPTAVMSSILVVMSVYGYANWIGANN
tara:strand:+ start:8958 stop:9194 length:237 start_codon:yes stop_codon:yes gene_type:complete